MYENNPPFVYVSSNFPKSLHKLSSFSDNFRVWYIISIHDDGFAHDLFFNTDIYAKL